MRSRNCRPRLVYFFAIEMTSRRFASTISFLAWAALTWPALMMVMTRLISSALALARPSATLISCWATHTCCCLGDGNFLAAFKCKSPTPAVAPPLVADVQRAELLEHAGLTLLRLRLDPHPHRLLALLRPPAARRLAPELAGLSDQLVALAEQTVDHGERGDDHARQGGFLFLGELFL